MRYGLYEIETGLIATSQATSQADMSAEQTSRRISWPKQPRAMLKRTVLSRPQLLSRPTVALCFFDLLLASKEKASQTRTGAGILAGCLILTG